MRGATRYGRVNESTCLEDDMKRRRRTETTIETYEVLAIRASRGPAQVWCPECGELARMVEPEAAARLAGISTRSIYGQIEAGRLHYEENKEGLLLICLKSVLQAAKVNSLFNRTQV